MDIEDNGGNHKLTEFLFPKPRDWETFEDIVCSVFSRRYDCDNFQRYARRGQAQHGVDVVGYTSEGIIGIQCKHHPISGISVDEIDDEISKSETFEPTLDKLIIATSANNDGVTHSHVLATSRNRIAIGDYPVEIEFWNKIIDELADYPDLFYKHFVKYFPRNDFEDLRFPALGTTRKRTLCWPTSIENLLDCVAHNLGDLEKIDPYRLTIGLSGFPNVIFEGLVDLEVSLVDQFSDESASEDGFADASQILSDIRSLLQPPSFSKTLTVYLQTRLTPAYLLGWIFRNVSGYQLQLVFRDQVWSTNDLPVVQSKLADDLPTILNPDSREVVLVLNISRNIAESVFEYVDNWIIHPLAILSLSLSGYEVTSAAHARSISLEISWKIKSLIDAWRVTHIHLFGAMPAALATLISFHLNAICPISIYFMNSTRSGYRLGGTLTNNL